MTRNELNQIINETYKDMAIEVSQDVYPEVEELYLLTDNFSKLDIASFWIVFDYQGIRNALEIARNYDEFKTETIYDKQISGNKISSSQYTYLEMIGWVVTEFKFEITEPWTSKK